MAPHTTTSSPVPRTMEAIVLDAFGPSSGLRRAFLEVRPPGPEQVLVRLQAAGIGSWDPFEREGGYAEMTGVSPTFPYVLGSDGAGTVLAVGDDVSDIVVGDVVCCSGFLDPDATFYAAATLVRAELCMPIPGHLDAVRSAGLPGAGITALRGLSAVLAVAPGDRVAITGASGALGHLAVQIARALGAGVTAVASGADGVELASRLGAVEAIDGRSTTTLDPGSVDKALLLAPGPVAESLARAVPSAHPTGVAIESSGSEQFNGEPDGAVTRQLERLVVEHRIEVHVHAVVAPGDIAAGHAALANHHLGKLVLDTSELLVEG